MTTRSLGRLKQEIIKAYNAINQEMYVVGVRQQRVEIFQDKILIVAEHKRIPVLAVLDGVAPDIACLADIALVRENKRKLAASLEAIVGVKVVTVLKDYDPATTLAATLIVFDATVSPSPT